MEQQSFGYWLKLKRKALDLTREALADRAADDSIDFNHVTYTGRLGGCRNCLKRVATEMTGSPISIGNGGLRPGPWCCRTS